MDFIELREKTQLNNIIEDSNSLPMGALIFKHSTRCSISRMVLDRFRREWNVPADDMSVYYLDLISFRSLSNEISEKFGVIHESPQVLLIKGGRSVYDASHNMISPRLIQQEALNG
tara:strand:- start:186 stop:533 length:348 start_codon:yes stop_codon:yes gene_type:complete